MSNQSGKFQAPALPQEQVEAPELGGTVTVRGLLLRERFALFENETNGIHGRTARLLAATVLDEEGKPLFSEEEWEQFGGVHFDTAMRLSAAAMRVTGFDKAQAEKNSDATQS